MEPGLDTRVWGDWHWMTGLSQFLPHAVATEDRAGIG